jgi:AcrR family transcriptional regulator
MTTPMNPPPNPRLRGRPIRSAQQIEHMKARIAEIAYAIFVRDGFEAVSMRRLAAEVGCTVMTVYKYYPRKIDILQALWARVFGILFDELDRIAAAQTNAVERLKAVAIGYVQFWLDRRDHYFLVFMSSNVDQADVSIFVGDDALLARFDIFRQGISGAISADISDKDLTLKSELLICALNGVSQNLITISGYPWTDPATLIVAAVDAVIDGKD